MKPYPTIEHTRRTLDIHVREARAGNPAFWAVIERASGRPDRRRRRRPGRRDRPRVRAGLCARYRAGGAAATPPRRRSPFATTPCGELALPELLALVQPGNAASINVLEKIGMERVGTRALRRCRAPPVFAAPRLLHGERALHAARPCGRRPGSRTRTCRPSRLRWPSTRSPFPIGVALLLDAVALDLHRVRQRGRVVHDDRDLARLRGERALVELERAAGIGADLERLRRAAAAGVASLPLVCVLGGLAAAELPLSELSSSPHPAATIASEQRRAVRAKRAHGWWYAGGAAEVQ